MPLSMSDLQFSKHCFVLFAIALFGSTGVADEPEIDFNRDVRPILSDKCYFCHGPDEENNKAGLRLDVREEAIDYIESGELLNRIHEDDEEVVMPPPESNLTLTGKDKAILEKWIEQGAKYEPHWAFQLLPASVDVPATKDDAWPRETLDRFVLSKIEQQGFAPSKEAPPERWLRRVTLDLTGLPPTRQETNEFAELIRSAGDDKTKKQRAFESVVQRLLSSPAFGEHMAIAWLDSARYADSYGYQSDKLNTQWPYRDWVIKAFNDNLPYDKFLTWQLAGDLMKSPTVEQKLATAFNRIHRLNNEGGAVFEEWRIENVADRVHTFGTAVLGLTMECCRCHDHKYDPIPMRDYYSLGAFFNSIDESGVYDRTEKVPCPSILLPTPEQAESLQQQQQSLVQAENTYVDQLDQAKIRWEKWQHSVDADTLSIPDLRMALSFDRDYDKSLKSFYKPSELDRAWCQMVPKVDVVDCHVPRMAHDHADQPASETPRKALKLDGERGITTVDIEPFDRWTPFTVVITLKETKRVPDRSLIAHHTRGTDCGYNGWDLTIVDGHLESRMYRVWPGNAIGVRTVDAIPADQWHQISATYDGSSDAAGLKLWLNGEPLETSVLRDEIKKSANVKVDHGGQFVVGQRFRARGLDGGLIDDVRVYFRPLTKTELNHLATGSSIEPTFEYFASAIDDSTRESFASLNEARQRFVMAEEVMTETPIMREMVIARPAYTLERGEYTAPKNDDTLVSRDTLSELPLPFPAAAPRNRLGLAQWVTDPTHPLTARVAVNRFWGNFFADPLVRTPENFGLQGDLPTHPKLLDWLARDFISSGWDVKRFCRNVVMSATYRQQSSATEDLVEADPTNRLLARGSAYRLAAEQIRDVALAASGLMNKKAGGPPVSPYQPGEDVWRESNGMSPAYKQSVGQSLYRRSLYSVWKRTAPLPNMMAFDTTSREVCTVKRSRTNTPLQALVLLNDVQFVEAARKLAENAMISDANDDQQIEFAFESLTGRLPDPQESEELKKLLDDERAWFGRTSYSQGVMTKDNYGRDHHPRCFTTWMAGGGIKPGITIGQTDEFGYNVVEDPMHVHDFNATILHLLGIDHERLTFKYQGRRFRLTDVHGHVQEKMLA